MSTAAPASPEITRFLREHPPFDLLDGTEVERVAGTVEVEFHRAGTTIFSEGAEPIEHLRVVRSGAVEIVHAGRVLDLLGEGELFGHAAMLSGLPAGFEARAAEDTLCYRIGADVVQELLAEPAALRFVARSLLESQSELDAAEREAGREPASQPVGSLIRAEPVICSPETSIRKAAQMMSERSATSLVVTDGNGRVGILTDRDLRSRVVADGISVDSPVSAAMSAPAYTCSPDQLGGEVLLEMLDRGFRHMPVVSATGEILGVIEDLDLVAVQTRSSFFLRQRITRAQTVAELQPVAAELRPAVIAMHDARIAAASISAIYSIVVDALTRRLLELSVKNAGPPPESAWLALGSQARREAVPSSDIDSAIVYFTADSDELARSYMHQRGKEVVAALEQYGFRSDPHGASASNLPFVRSVRSWQRAARSWIDDPTGEKALLLASVMVDSRPVWGIHTGTPLADTFRLAPDHPDLLRLMARFACSHRPPTGFFRGLVVEHTGEHRGTLDLKQGGLTPIIDLARWAGMAAGVTSASTSERLHAAAASGTLPEPEVHTLSDAFELITSLRLGHQVEQLRAGAEPDDFVDPATLSPLMRSHLRGAFRAVASIQKRITTELKAGTF